MVNGIKVSNVENSMLLVVHQMVVPVMMLKIVLNVLLVQNVIRGNHVMKLSVSGWQLQLYHQSLEHVVIQMVFVGMSEIVLIVNVKGVSVIELEIVEM